VNRERIFNLPGVVTALIAVLFAIQVLVELFPQSIGAALMVYFSFIPARLSFLLAPNSVLQALAEVDIDGDELAAFLNTTRFSWWTPLTYAFLHANWTHLGVNSLTLAAFGAPVAKRLGSARFLVFFAVTAIAGALAHLAAHPFDLGPVVGASAAISGAMGAIVRFAFGHGEALGEPINDPSEAQAESRGFLSLARLFSNQRATLFMLTWLGANLLFGLVPQAPGGVGVIAWEAHIGGFLAGLLLFGWFDPARRAGRR
jgi:membrane associated rhomboid family serine protease